MQRLRDLTISSTTLDAGEIVAYVQIFSTANDGWDFLEEESSEYARLLGEPSCCLIYKRGDFPKAALHLTMNKAGALGVGLCLMAR